MQSPLTDDEVANVARPIETAIGLPNRAYTDEAFLDAEREQILARRWIAVAFAHDVPAPLKTDAPEVLPSRQAGASVLLDKRAAAGPARERLYAQRAAPGVEIQGLAHVDSGRVEHREQRLPKPIRCGTRGPPRGDP